MRNASSRQSGAMYLCAMALLTVLLIFKVHFGLFHDEVYLLNSGKLALGPLHHFTQIWDYLQLEGYFQALFMGPYQAITGGYEGVLLYMRYVYVFIQLVLSVYTYFTTRLYWSERQAQAASVAVYLYVFSFYSVQYKSIFYWTTLLTILLLLRWHYSGKEGYLVLSALILSGGVLCYPTLAIYIIPTTAFVWKYGNGNRKEIGIYWGICVACAALFIFSVLKEMPLSTLAGIYTYMTGRANHNFSGVPKRTAIVFAVFAVAGGTSFLFNKWKRLSGMFQDPYLFATAFTWLGLFVIISAKYQTASASRVWYIFVFLFAYLFLQRKDTLKTAAHADLIEALFYDWSLWALLAIDLATNQDLAIVAYGSVFGLIGAILVLSDEKDCNYIGAKPLVGSVLLILLCSTIFFVPDENMMVESSHIFQKRETITSGAGKGLYVTAYTKDMYDVSDTIAQKYIDKSDKLMLIGDAFDYVIPLSSSAEEVAHLGNDAPFGGLRVRYCEMFPEWAPTVVAVKTDIIGDYDAWIDQSALGQYLQAHYDTDHAVRFENWLIIR